MHKILLKSLNINSLKTRLQLKSLVIIFAVEYETT